MGVNMSKPVTIDNTSKSYYDHLLSLPTEARDFLNRRVDTLRSYGSSFCQFGSNTVKQLSAFAGRIAAFDDITDQAMLGLSRGMKKGALIGAIVGLFSIGPIGILPGVYYGANMGALLGFFKGFSDAFDAYDETVRQSSVAQNQ